MGFSDDFDVVEAKLIEECELEGENPEIDPDEDDKIIWDNQLDTPKAQKVVWHFRIKTGVVIGLSGLAIAIYKAFSGLY